MEFYRNVFGWTIETWEGPMEYWRRFSVTRATYTSSRVMKMEKINYLKARDQLNESFSTVDTAADYLQEILRIWTEHGFLAGEWSCTLKREEAV